MFSAQDLQTTYKTPVLIFESDGFVYITLTFPVMHTPMDTFEIYKVLNFPFFLNNTVVIFEIDPKISGLAVNRNTNTYRLLTAGELSECTMRHTHACNGKS